MDNCIGLLVCSLAGRDEGITAAVVGVVDENYVLISDGKLRKCETPKKKKLKHLRVITDEEGNPIKLEESKLTNRLIRESIRDFETRSI